jgi:hypothetical protein
MLHLLAELFKSPAVAPFGVHMREALTPGQLYRLMSAEFRTFRAGSCCCAMPMVFTCEPGRFRACNWSVHAVTSGCGQCQLLADEIVARHAAVYDVNDPTYVPPGQREIDGEGFPLFS